MSWAHLSPEAREAARVKGLEKRRANKAAKLAALEAGPEISQPVDLVPVIEPDPTLDLLSDEEIEEIRAQEKKKYDAEKKNLLKKAAAEQIRLELRRTGGDIPDDEEQVRRNKEMVLITIRMPRLRKPNGGEQDPEPIIIDRKMFAPNRTYEVTRGQADMLQWIMDSARKHVNSVDGRSRSYYSGELGTVIHQGGIASGGGSLGTSFDSIHRRPA